MPIRKLPPLLVNQIAAGEVIERPASVVKELVENSLDAGARRIRVDIEDGGSTLIRIADDGQGIPENELPLAVASHATSKLQTAEDLEAIATLGFRGEALASIASVSRLRITSRPHDANEGHSLESNGGQITGPRPAAASPGTTLEIRDLFFNTPARRKFLRAPQTEFGHIADTLNRVAVVHPQVGFTLTHNGRTTTDLLPTEDAGQRCIDLLGREIAEGLLPFELVAPPDKGGARVWGMAGLPQLARANSKGLYICINARPVRDRNLQHAVKEAYRGLMPPDKHPVGVVLIEMDPAMVDVNVHPTKAEVRFREPGRMHGLVLSALRQRLLAEDLTPKLEMGDAAWRKTDGTTPNPSANEFVDYFRKMDPKQKGFVYEEVRRELATEQPELMASQPDYAPAPNPQHLTPTPILQVHESYVVTQDVDGIVIVDQHALHERVMFEELTRRVLGKQENLESQRLLMPAVVQASAKRQALLGPLAPLLEKIGMEVEPFGGDAVAVQAFPSFLFDRGVEPVEFLEELLDRAEAGEFDTARANAQEAALHEVLDMMSCKAAVKAGDRLSEDELASLLAKRDEVERSSNCPHGRPTQIRLTIRDLEKRFGRS